MSEEEAHVCDCDNCVYAREAQRVTDLQPNDELKKFVDDLYWRYAMEQDDSCMLRGRWREVKPLLHELSAQHFSIGRPRRRRSDHDACRVCEILEHVL